MIELWYQSGDLARLRFARSPMQELMTSMLVGRRTDRARMHQPWARSVRGSVAALRLDLLRPLLDDPRYFPDFLTPTPGRMDTRFTDELDRLRATPAAVVRSQLELLGGAAPPPDALRSFYDDPDRQLGRLAAEIQSYWAAAIEPIWPRLAALLDAEMDYRADQLTSGGIVRLLGNLHPELEYAPDALRIRWPTWQTQGRLDGTGLTLVPCVFVWPALLVDIDPLAPKLIYSPRGVGQVWDGSARRPALPIADLLGRSRATLLAKLDLPLSTTQVARELGQSPSSISEHLSVLRRSGLVTSRRSGRSVLYQRTTLGTELLGAAAPGDHSARSESWSRRIG
ncbi:helix-turn-helix domain-containing protein [Actinoplanes sp. NPDC023801]|uniref:ArsR family transcriptional regulator n=1 Tax=Actinoplanes sp. NPDC023801 TaxID=3154595 RepID=UPI0033D35735